MRIVRSVVLLALAVALFVALDRPWPVAGARIPPPGRLLDPFVGLWSPGAASGQPPESVRLTGLRGPVTVLWDERDVPHVFAEHDRDLYLVQGWLTARHRLWQMDIQALATAGRLSEVLGRATLERDRLQHRLGVPDGADALLRRSIADPGTRDALEAYAEGVNAWIDGLPPDRFPLEYKLLADRPRPWTPYRSALALRGMAQLLALAHDDLDQTRAMAKWGRSTVEALFPTRAPFVDPIVPPGTTFDFEPVPVPTAPESIPIPPGLRSADDDGGDDGGGADGTLGSNHWVVAADRSASGRPILAGDPHLPLRLPSVWYEIHLHGPDHAVYGVSLPGVPGVTIGFNRHAAWSFTNAYSDVTDWRSIEFADDGLDRWRRDGAWVSTEWRERTIRVRDADDAVERVPWTRHGPVPVPPGETSPRSWIPASAALRWTGHDPSDEISALLRLNRARTAVDLDEVVERFDVPPQNVAFAFDDGTVGVVHAGRIPLRWPEQGRYVGDGADPRFDWAGTIPRSHLPRIVDPPRGYAGSANQPPVGSDYPYWLGWNYGRWERGARIHALLRRADAVGPEDMIAMQEDTLSDYARRLLPVLLSTPDLVSGPEDPAILDDLRAWDFRYRADATAPTVFDRWQRALTDAIWSDDVASEPPDPRLPRPRRDVTLDVVLEGASAWIDDRTTPATESLDDLAREAFRTATDELRSRLGPFGEAWNWGRVRPTRIDHRGGLEGFGVTGLAVDGQYGTLRAVTGSAGPSWRMVVELGDPPRAWGEYPGGQDGDPASARYLDGVDAWRRGRVRELWFPNGPDEHDARRSATTRLEPRP